VRRAKSRGRFVASYTGSTSIHDGVARGAISAGVVAAGRLVDGVRRPSAALDETRDRDLFRTMVTLRPL
jgi:hypothetical protein